MKEELGKCCATCAWCLKVEDEKSFEGYDETDLNKPKAGDCMISQKHDENFLCKEYNPIDELEDIKVIYDDTYLGEGYFITYEIAGTIYKFIKIYTTGYEGFPIFHIRAYERGAKDQCDQILRDIEINVYSDKNPELYESLVKLNNRLNSKIVITIDPINQGDNHIKVRLQKDYISLIATKNVFKGNFTNADYIDIILGDNYSCEDYNAIQKFYTDLGRISEKEVDEKFILSKILK